MRKDTTGYDPKEEKESGVAYFHLRLVGDIYSKGLYAVVDRNEEPIGVLRMESKEEFDWLAQRVNGSFRPEKKSID